MGNDREAARLVARIDERDVGDAVARHVVVIGRGAQLLRRKMVMVSRPSEASAIERPQGSMPVGCNGCCAHPVGERSSSAPAAVVVANRACERADPDACHRA